jgi:5-methylcytosine-specific restriction endonuclease McrA
VLAKNGKPLMPTRPARARKLLKNGKAVVHKTYPFTIRLKERLDGDRQSIALRIDPGSKTTGIALIREGQNVDDVLHLSELIHRGSQIRKKMSQRAAFRRRRRSANLRYRKKRFNNRARPEGWLPPSLQARVDNISSWAKKYQKLAPLSSITMERVRFDTQKLQNPEISGVEYQQGTLQGYELREYLLEKWGRHCAYCGQTDVPLQIEHIVARSKGGSNRVSNLTLACEECNQKKGNTPIEDFLKGQPALLKRITAQMKTSLRDAAAMNATRNALWRALNTFGLPVFSASGGQTKFNRSRFGIPKSHCLDAACVGNIQPLIGWQQPILHITAMGRGRHQRTRLDRFGFPRGYLMAQKSVHGFQTGDIVKAVVPSGKKAGVHTGRVAIRKSGSFNIKTEIGTVQGISHKHCRILQRNDGYGYHILNSHNERGASSQD